MRAAPFARFASVSVAEPDTPASDETQASAGARSAPGSLLHPWKRSSEVGVDRFSASWTGEGLPQALVAESITRLATEIAPAVRAASASEAA
jgi:hypothetical protein